MKKVLALILFCIMLLSFAVPVSAYILSPEEIYGEPDRGYDEGYKDGVEDSVGTIIYRAKENSIEKYIADHETRFRELYITLLLVLGICVVPILIYRYGLKKDSFADCDAIIISVVYNVFAGFLITFIMYRIDNLVPCLSVVVLWGMLCKRILSR